jgi:hypothetical protein
VPAPFEVVGRGTEVEVVGIGAVTAGIETLGVVVSPELSLPQPTAAAPMAIAANTAAARITGSRRGPAGAVRNRGSR